MRAPCFERDDFAVDHGLVRHGRQPARSSGSCGWNRCSCETQLHERCLGSRRRLTAPKSFATTSFDYREYAIRSRMDTIHHAAGPTDFDIRGRGSAESKV